MGIEELQKKVQSDWEEKLSKIFKKEIEVPMPSKKYIELYKKFKKHNFELVY